MQSQIGCHLRNHIWLLHYWTFRIDLSFIEYGPIHCQFQEYIQRLVNCYTSGKALWLSCCYWKGYKSPTENVWVNCNVLAASVCNLWPSLQLLICWFTRYLFIFGMHICWIKHFLDHINFNHIVTLTLWPQMTLWPCWEYDVSQAHCVCCCCCF